MATQLHDIPGAFQATYQLRAHAAATATEQAYCFVAPFACKIRSVQVIWDAAITGADTNSSSVGVLNTGTDGTGTTALGTAVAYVSGTDAAQGATVDLYAPSPYTAIAVGVKLAVQITKVGTGLALPTGLVVVTYEGN